MLPRPLGLGLVPKEKCLRTELPSMERQWRGGGAGDSLRLGDKQKLRAFVFKMAFETSKIEKEKRKKSGYVL